MTDIPLWVAQPMRGISRLQAAMQAVQDAPKIKIHGRDYTPVAPRVEAFRKNFATDHSIETELLSNGGDLVVVRAVIRDDKGRIVATGLAEENRNSGQINRTSALENCETSAIGRALANLGLHGGEYASSNEVENAVHQQKQEWTVAELKERLRAFRADIDACDDHDSLLALLNTKDSQEIINQCIRKKPEWYHGDGTPYNGEAGGTQTSGIAAYIEYRKRELQEKNVA